MTSFIAAGGSGRSTSVIPAVPAASSVTTIAFMGIVSSLACLFGGLRTNVNGRLPAHPLGRVVGCNGIAEGSHGLGGAARVVQSTRTDFVQLDDHCLRPSRAAPRRSTQPPA